MAQVLAGDISKIVGKVGDKVYVRYKNGIYVRKAPTVRKGARTPAMLLNQQRFGCITRHCTQFKNSLISMIWNDAATTGSGYNRFMNENSSAFAKDGRIVYPLLLKFSTGKLSVPEHLTAQRTVPEAETIEVLWEKETHIYGTRQKDDLVMIGYDGVEFTSMIATGIRRRDVGGHFNLPVMKDKVQYIYLFFASEDRRSFSDSVGFTI